MLRSHPQPPLAAWFAASLASSEQLQSSERLQHRALACVLPHLSPTFRYLRIAPSDNQSID